MNWPGILSLALCLCLWDGGVWAGETISDPTPRVVDGDTLWVGRAAVRLQGMDAPEWSQSCADAAGETWACGIHAARALRAAAAGGVTCRVTGVDSWHRLVGTCAGAAGDLGATVVRAGLAAAWGARYAGEEGEARAARRGVWAGTWVLPWRWRKLGRRTHMVREP